MLIFLMIMILFHFFISYFYYCWTKKMVRLWHKTRIKSKRHKDIIAEQTFKLRCIWFLSIGRCCNEGNLSAANFTWVSHHLMVSWKAQQFPTKPWQLCDNFAQTKSQSMNKEYFSKAYNLTLTRIHQLTLNLDHFFLNLSTCHLIILFIVWNHW
jgi:hypothetical protein